MTNRRGIIGCAIGLLFTAVGFAQEFGWPLELRVPSAEPPDSSRTVLSLSDKIQEHTFKSANRYTMQVNTPHYYFSQNGIYELEYQSPPLDFSNHFFDFSGSLFRKAIPFSGTSVGLAWNPIGVINLPRQYGDAQAWIDFGPSVRFDAFGLPIGVGSGISGKLWNERLATSLQELTRSEFHGDAGYFGSLSMGDPGRAVRRDLPLYFGGSLYGRDIRDSRIVSANGSALFAQDMSTGDSLFLYYSDALSDGRNAFLGKSADGSLMYISTSRRRGRSLAFESAVKARPLYMSVPQLTYTHAINSIDYPGSAELMFRNELTKNDMIGFLLTTTPEAPFSYRGGLRFGVERYDRLSNISDTSVTDIRVAQTDIEDYVGFTTTMFHRIARYFPDSTGIVYAYAIERTSKTYPTKFVIDKDTVRSYDDNDRIRQRHLLSFTPLSLLSVKLTAGAEYYQNLTNYISGKKSGVNCTDRLYRISSTISVVPAPPCSLAETVTADAKTSQYMFPRVHSSDPPPYSRRLTSRLNANYGLSGTWRLSGIWEETYWDDGCWSGKAFDKVRGYYAIQRKSWDHGLQLSASCTYRPVLLEFGSSFKDIYYREFQGETYTINSLGTGYSLIPFVRLKSVFHGSIIVSAALSRFIDTIADDYWDGKIALQWNF